MVISKTRILLIFIGVLAFLGMLALYIFWNPSETNIFPKCPIYATTGIYCAGCGSQRAIHQILNGHFIEGIKHNYLIVFLTLVLVYQGFIFIMNKVLNKNVSNILNKPKVIISILVIIILFMVLRNIPVFPFTELAP